jgi:competence protein ComGC
MTELNYTQPVVPRKGLAITSLTLGIIGIPTIGLCFVGGITGIILGVMALNKIKNDPAHFTGRGIAISGIIVSALSLVLAIPIAAAIAIPNLLKSKQLSHEISAVSDVRKIAQAQELYSMTEGNGKYADLRTLGALGLIDEDLASGIKGGYHFTSEPFVSESHPMFDTTAVPVSPVSGNRSFGSNETNVIYEAKGSVILKGSPTNRTPPGGTPMN